MNAISQYLLILAVQASLISAFAYVAMLVFRKSSVIVHTIGVTCTLLLLASPILVAVLPFNGIVARAFIDQPADRRIDDSVNTSTNLRQASSQQESAITPIERAETASIDVPPYEDSRHELASRFLTTQNLVSILGFVWLIGASCLTVLRLISHLRLLAVVVKTWGAELDASLGHHLQKVFGRKLHPDVRICETISIPFVFGTIKPRIFVPSSVWESKPLRQDVITHEVAHIVRNDHWYHLAQRIVSTIYWWQPLVHAINRRVSNARECIVDNYVLRGSDSCSYAETLLAVAERSLGLHSLYAIAFLNDEPLLEQRIKAVLDENRSLQVHSSLPARSLIAVVGSLMIILGGGLGALNLRVIAQDKVVDANLNEDGLKESNPNTNANDDVLKNQAVRTASGRILDTKGNPVADCLLIAETKDGQEIVVHTDTQGNYTITFPTEERYPGSYRAWAYKQGFNARPLHFGRYLNKQQSATGLDVTLPELTSIQVRVLSPTGKPLQGARVGPYYYDLPNGSFSTDVAEGMGGPPTNSLWQQTAGLTDASGNAALSGYSQQLIGGVLVKTSEYGDQICYSDLKEALPTLRLKPVGSIHGVLLTDDPKKYEGQVVRLEGNRGLPSEVRSDVYVKFDSHGEFHVAAFAAGSVGARFYGWDNEFDVLPTLIPNNPELQASTELKLKFKLIKGVKISGQIIKSDTRVPIPDTNVSIWNSASIANPSVQTKQDGSFVGYVMPGSIQIHATSFGPTGEGYDYPEWVNVQAMADQKEIDLGRLAATPYHEIEFWLRNAEGRPIAMQDFGITSTRPLPAPRIYLRAKTDELGVAKLKLNKHFLREIGSNRLAQASFSPRENNTGFYMLENSKSNSIDPAKKLSVTSIIANEIWLAPAEGE